MALSRYYVTRLFLLEVMLKRLTDTQKTAIVNLRASGHGYKAIAEKLSLSRETVRSYCSRHDIPARVGRNRSTVCAGMDDVSEIKSGNTVFVISTGYSEKATETLKEKLEKLILDAASKMSGSYQFVQE